MNYRKIVSCEIRFQNEYMFFLWKKKDILDYRTAAQTMAVKTEDSKLVLKDPENDGESPLQREVGGGGRGGRMGSVL
jgi:hypothetical protein